MMLIRANVLAKGFSGIRPVVAERLCQMIERCVTPVVPSQGSVGASGDLAPLAHMALVLMGEGEAEFAGARMPGREALRLAGVEPVALASKEGISLVNGTQAMLAVGCLELTASETLIDTAEVVCALTLDAQRAGTALVHVHFTPYWALAGGPGCVAPAGDLTLLTLKRAGPIRLVTRFAFDRIGARSPRCT